MSKIKAWNSYLTAYGEAIKLFKIVIGELALYLHFTSKNFLGGIFYLLSVWYVSGQNSKILRWNVEKPNGPFVTESPYPFLILWGLMPLISVVMKR